MIRPTPAVTLAVTLLAIVSVAGQERHRHDGGDTAASLGTVTFANSGAPAAQAPFLRGLALLHSFEYD